MSLSENPNHDANHAPIALACGLALVLLWPILTVSAPRFAIIACIIGFALGLEALFFMRLLLGKEVLTGGLQQRSHPWKCAALMLCASIASLLHGWLALVLWGVAGLGLALLAGSCFMALIGHRASVVVGVIAAAIVVAIGVRLIMVLVLPVLGSGTLAAALALCTLASCIALAAALGRKGPDSDEPAPAELDADETAERIVALVSQMKGARKSKQDKK